MITASTDFYLITGASVKYTALSVLVDYTYSAVQQTYLCNVYPAIISAGGTTPAGSFTTLITKASVDAKTGSGTNPSDKLGNQIDQVIKDYLAAITENSAVTFTVT